MCFFFVKQKTAYELRISDWSSDVCSSDLLAPVEFAYETYGTLNAERSNAILICHALTLDQYVASTHLLTGKQGWWTRMVGEGKPIDPARHFIICVNVLGSCMGSSGPASIDPATGVPFGMTFPVVTIADMVRAQAMLLDYMGIERLRSEEHTSELQS